MKKIRWGIISTGNIANQFASDFQYSQLGVLEAVASRNQEKADKFAQSYGIGKAYASYQDLFNDPDIDAVYVATPHNLHFQNCKDAILQGKAVLSEKPITTSSGAAIELFNFAKAHNIYLMEGVWTYFLPAMIQAQKWIDDGKIGDLLHIKGDFGFQAEYDPNGRLFNPDLAGGAMLDIGIYPIAAACLLIPGMPKKVSVSGHFAPTGVEDEVIYTLHYDDKVSNNTASFRSTMRNELQIMGTKATISIPDFWRASECYLLNRSGQIDEYQEGREGIGYYHELEAMNKDLLNEKKESSVVPHSRSIQIQRVIEMVQTELRK
ncbi:MAG: Gfo/Idh/MocA family oxidoreductase [Cyclobacteriaceae bacterium]